MSEEKKSHQLTVQAAKCESPFSRWMVLVAECPCGVRNEWHTAGGDRPSVEAAVALAGILFRDRKQARAQCAGCGANLYLSKPLVEIAK